MTHDFQTPVPWALARHFIPAQEAKTTRAELFPLIRTNGNRLRMMLGWFPKGLGLL